MKSTRELRALLEKRALDFGDPLRRAFYGGAIGLPIGAVAGALTPVSPYEPTPLERRLINMIYGAGAGLTAGTLGSVGAPALANVLAHK